MFSTAPSKPHSCSSLYLPFSFSAKAKRYLSCVRPVQTSVTKVGGWNNCEWIATGRAMQPSVIILGPIFLGVYVKSAYICFPWSRDAENPVIITFFPGQPRHGKLKCFFFFT